MATFGQLLHIGKKRKDFPKSVPPLPVVEKTVYIRVCLDGNYLGKMDWYVVKLSSNDYCSSPGGKRKRGKGAAKITAVAIKPISEEAETTWWSSYVALGSTIYCIGGGGEYKDSSRKVGATDAVNGGDGGMTMTRRKQWRQVTQLKAKRTRAQAVAVDDKIYVFGGLRNSKGPEIEVFDPIKKTGESIQQSLLPFNFTYRFFVTYDDASKRIILGSFCTGVLLAYDVTKGGSGGDPWHELDTGFEYVKNNVSRPVFFENALYWIHTGIGGVVELVLYDMDLKMSADAPILGFGHHFYAEGKYYKPPLFHFRGNEFYLIWLDVMDIDGKYRSLIRCTRILVSKRVDKKKQRIRVKAFCLSTKTYLLPKQVHLLDVVVLEGTSSDKEVEKLEEEDSAELASE